MTEILDTIHLLLRGVHIGLGFVGLAIFWIIAFLPKGSRTHLLFGRTFVAIAYVVGGTALFSSVWALADVDSFAPFINNLESTRANEIREVFRFLFLILLFLSTATLSGAAYGVRLMKARERHGELRHTFMPFWLSLCLATSLTLVGFGVYRLTMGVPEGASMPWAAYQVPVYLGLFGAFSAVKELRYIYFANPPRRSWLYKHVEEMFGTGIAFHTAFIVFGASRLFGYQLQGVWALVPWVGPPVLGLALTSWYVRRLRRANGDLPSLTSKSSIVEAQPANVEA